ncbi:chloride channel protein B-like isoform X1 [Branchiostoma floridae x Branchiostoma japonicum]
MRRQTYSLSQRPPPQEDDTNLASGNEGGFFARGREFESRYVNHHYTKEEREELAKYESLDYLPSHSVVYKNWLKRQANRLDWDRWVMMGLIGFTVGFTGFLLHQVIDVLANLKWDRARDYLGEDQLLVTWGWVLGLSVALVIVGSGMVVFLAPAAAGSGLPELIGYLNGTVVHQIFNIKTFLVKFISCACAVASGLPVGPEGPMIHMGGMVGAGLGQFRSGTLGLRLPCFARFRNSEDRRNFISAGAGAGVASAFGAPVGGLLFAMEEVSSYWNMKLSWQIFFCCMVATVTTDLFNSAFEGFIYKGDFGLFKAEKYIIFQVKSEIAVNIIAFVPAFVLGVLGGMLGSLFNFLNLKVARFRRMLLAKTSSYCGKRLLRMSEPVLIMILMATAAVFLPAAFDCTPVRCEEAAAVATGNTYSCLGETSRLDVEQLSAVETHTCPQPGVSSDGNGTESTLNGTTYNQVATLMFVTGEEGIHHLFSRETHRQFDYAPLLTVLAIYFTLACWCAGSAISSGLVVPMLFIGGLYGRVIGQLLVTLFGVHYADGNRYWAWMDPGAFALIGAASFFGGVSRLTMSLTVIMIEITNDVQFLLLIMVAIMVAKWVGDFVTHPIYHALLELKCIPFLDAEPVIMHDGHEPLNLELHCAEDAMSSPARMVHLVEPVSNIAQLLLDTPHGGYPVVHAERPGEEPTFYGMITRMELCVLLLHEEVFDTKEIVTEASFDQETLLDYNVVAVHKLQDPDELDKLLTKYRKDPKYQTQFVNLQPYVNQSALCVRDNFSLHRTYIIFRTMGMRHLPVVDSGNHMVGVITRKTLMGFSLEERLTSKLQSELKQTMMMNGRASLKELTEQSGDIVIKAENKMVFWV